MKTTIYMIRHAESPFIYGQERTRKLSKQGEADAKNITNIMMNKGIDLIISSPYTRAIQTISGIAQLKNLEIKSYEELRERQLKGDYKLPKQERLKAIKQSYEDYNFKLVGGESMKEVQTRALPIIKKYLQTSEGKTMIIGTHGNVMTVMMNYFNQAYGYEFWLNTSKPDIYKMTFIGENLHAIKRVWQ